MSNLGISRSILGLLLPRTYYNRGPLCGWSGYHTWNRKRACFGHLRSRILVAEQDSGCGAGFWLRSRILVAEQDSGSQYACPCTNSQSAQSTPSFVGQDYFCETGITGSWSPGGFYPDGDPLWDGEDCGSGSTCCELNGPPYFCTSLTEPTTEDIEVRIICSNEPLRSDTPIELIEIFVQ